jgi:cell wall-associated NlpC family hydrolase
MAARLAAGVLSATVLASGATSVALAAPAPAQAAVTAAASTGAAHAASDRSVSAQQASRARRARRLRVHVWRYAMHQHNKPYIYGGTGPHGFDCSGLVYASYRSRGVHLPRTTYGMLGSWHLVRVRKSKAHRGDLAFFGSGHVELFDHGHWTYGAAHSGTRIGFHKMNRWWHPTRYFRVRR